MNRGRIKHHPDDDVLRFNFLVDYVVTLTHPDTRRLFITQVRRHRGDDFADRLDKQVETVLSRRHDRRLKRASK